MRAMLRAPLVATLLLMGQGCQSDQTPVSPTDSGPLLSEGRSWSRFSDWSTPLNLGPVVNSASNDQHPSISRNGLALYFVSNRPGGFGLNDIWFTRRATLDAPWGPPQNLGSAINTASNDFAPDLTSDGRHLYMNSDRPGGCGGSDLYVAQRPDRHDDFGWNQPTNLGCEVNTTYDEAGPLFFEDEKTGIEYMLFTSFNRPGGLGDFDIYQSTRRDDSGQQFGPAVGVTELNGPYRDTRTAISADGLELFLSSDATGRSGGIGGQDLWRATRTHIRDPWSTPVSLGSTVNSADFDGAPALSYDGTTLYFFSNRPGGSGANDLYVTTRTRLHESREWLANGPGDDHWDR